MVVVSLCPDIFLCSPRQHSCQFGLLCSKNSYGYFSHPSRTLSPLLQRRWGNYEFRFRNQHLPNVRLSDRPSQAQNRRLTCGTAVRIDHLTKAGRSSGTTCWVGLAGKGIKASDSICRADRRSERPTSVEASSGKALLDSNCKLRKYSR